MKSGLSFGIFDLDGTIVNSIQTYSDVFCGILSEKYGISDNDMKEHLYYLNSTGTPLGEQFKHILEINGKPTAGIPEMTREFFDKVNGKDFVLFDGAKSLLGKLAKKGFKLFITTGSEDEMTKVRLDKAGILEYFELVLGSSMKEKGPWHVERFANAAKVPIDEFSKKAFYCGDGPYDMLIAKMFGIYAIGVTSTVSRNMLMESGADIVIEKISDLEELKVLE